MAASRLFQFRYSYEREVTELLLKINIGASGAPTIANGKGLVSITRNATGKYTLVLKDNFNLLLAVDSKFISGSSAPAAPSVNVVSEQVNNTTTPSLIIQCRDIAAAAADPASGEVMMLRITCRNAST